MAVFPLCAVFILYVGKGQLPPVWLVLGLSAGGTGSVGNFPPELRPRSVPICLLVVQASFQKGRMGQLPGVSQLLSQGGQAGPPWVGTQLPLTQTHWEQ